MPLCWPNNKASGRTTNSFRASASYAAEDLRQRLVGREVVECQRHAERPCRYFERLEHGTMLRLVEFE